MFFLSTIFSATAFLVQSVLSLYMWAVIISVLLTWVRPDPYNPLVRTLNALTEPVLWRARRLLPFLYVNGLDLSPIAVILALQFLSTVLVRCLEYLAMQTMIAS